MFRALKEPKQLSLENFPKEGSSFQGKVAKYKVVKLLGKGGFGAVYQVQSSSDEKMYAAKLESYEHPRRLGSSLHILRTSQPGSRFSLGTSLRFAQQALEALQDMHSIGFIHRDIKPSNFGVGRRETNDLHIVYIFDFGLARQFATSEKDRRVPRKLAPFRGTPRYASMNSHNKKEQSPKDDVESWFYMVVEWTAGALPWRRFKNRDRDQILVMKQQVREPGGFDMLLDGCPLPHYRMILEYIDGLEYLSIPDYGYIYFLLKHAARKNHIPPDQPLDHDPEHPYNGTETPPSCLPQGVLIATLEKDVETARQRS